MNSDPLISEKVDPPFRRTRAASKRFWLLYGVVAVITFFCLWWWTRNEDPQNPSRAEVLKHNYYLFVLPETTVSNYGWEEHIFLNRWENTCHFIDATDRYNPLTIRYDKDNSDSFFFVSVDPWNSSWSDGDTETIALEKSWLPSSTITRFLKLNSSRTQTKFLFSDHVGNPVYIISSLPTEETLELVDSVELIEPEGMTDFNPWDCP
jgi:hypothetical protein